MCKEKAPRNLGAFSQTDICFLAGSFLQFMQHHQQQQQDTEDHRFVEMTVEH